MNRTDYGKLIAALRKEHFDPVAGKVWTQRMLAERTGLLPRTISEIERGHKTHLDADTLLRLATAFGLTTLERCEFFAAASEVDEAHVMRNPHSNTEQIFQNAWETLQKLRLPAILHDAFFDLQAVNSLVVDFHHIPIHVFQTKSEDNIMGGANFLAWFFGPQVPLRIAAPQSWQALARQNVRQFRWMTLRYRYTDYFQALFAALNQDAQFRTLWAETQQAQKDHYSRLKSYFYHHAAHGPVAYTITTTPLITTCGVLYLETLVPNDGETWDVVASLFRTSGIHGTLLTPWPNPELYM